MLINTTTYRASSGGVSRVNEFDENPSQPCFILNKLAQLPECPGVMLPPLTFANRDAVSYPLKVFKGLGGDEALFLIIGHTAAWVEIIVIFFFRKKKPEKKS